jgi:hypothetical protein
MNLLVNIFQRLFNSPKTTTGGVVAGTGFAVAISAILDQAGCQFSNVQWWEIMSMVFGGPALVGGLATDNGKQVVPISPLTGPGTGIGAILISVMTVGLVACSTYNVDVKNGRVNITETTEERSPFGTNMGFARVANCKYEKLNINDVSPTPTECNPVTNWIPMYSQGQGGQIVGGALTGVGAGVGGAMVNTGNSVIQSVTTTTGGRGH